jgi:hypothetical protein
MEDMAALVGELSLVARRKLLAIVLADLIAKFRK